MDSYDSELENPRLYLKREIEASLVYDYSVTKKEKITVKKVEE